MVVRKTFGNGFLEQRHLESSADFRIVQQTLKSNYEYDNAVFCLSDIFL